MNKKDKHIKLENNSELSKNVFDVPEGYFNNLQSKLIENSESILNQSDNLKELPFEVPTNYFEELTENILDKTVGSETKVIPLTQQLWFKVSSVAASFIVIASFYFLMPSEPVVEPSFTNISDDTIIEYLNAQQSSQEDLLEGLDSLDLILEDILSEELNVFAEVLSTNTELNYDFEYFDY